MENNLNSGDLTKLQVGQTLLTNFRKIKGGKISLELAEVKEGSRGLSAAYVFNQSDNRFSMNSARRAWQAGTPADLEALFGVNLGDDQDWIMDDRGFEILSANILNPKVVFNGQQLKLRVQIVETTKPDEYQANNVESTAKRAGRDGDYILHKGSHVFSNATVVFHEPADVYLESDPRVGEIETQNKAEVADILNEKVDVNTGEILT